jgi:hypothetical protein
MALTWASLGPVSLAYVTRGRQAEAGREVDVDGNRAMEANVACRQWVQVGREADFELVNTSSPLFFPEKGL